jgi:hypothetical protein
VHAIELMVLRKRISDTAYCTPPITAHARVHQLAPIGMVTVGLPVFMQLTAR